MSAKWPLVNLGYLLTLSDEYVTLVADEDYREVTVRMRGKGITLRGIVKGLDIASKQRRVVRKDQFLLARIDARQGACGIVPAELDGAVVTNDFLPYWIDDTKLLPAYLNWLSKTEDFVEKLKRASEGTTNRVRIKEHLFLALEIPLPPLELQRRLVARIEAVAALVAEAQTLRKGATEEVEALKTSLEFSFWPASSLDTAVTLQSLTTYLARGRQSEQGESEHYLVKTQHVQMGKYIPTVMRLATHIAPKVTADAVLVDRDILIACSAAGCLGRVARYVHRGHTTSTDTHIAIARPNGRVVDPDYLYAYLKGAQGQYQLRSRERGDWQREKISFRLTELNLNDLRQVPVPLPNLNTQRRIVRELDALQVQVDALKALQAETQAELDGMMAVVLNEAFNGRFAERAYEQPKGVVLDLPLAAEPAAPYGTSRTLGWIDQVTFNAWMVHVANKDKTFGRTKAEKVEHLIESVLGNDHGRNAVRDKAGPVDYERRSEVEVKMTSYKWAWVEEKKLKDGGTMYLYHTGPEIAHAVRHVEALLGNGLKEAERIVQIMRPLNTEACEVRATLYAAWNDLIQAKQPSTDGDILKDVYAWHPKKGDIAETKWLAGLKWLRDNNLVPAGNAKPVRAK